MPVILVYWGFFWLLIATQQSGWHHYEKRIEIKNIVRSMSSLVKK